uniref:Uncharacterized protein n=1 Tax=Myotis myotis TaxID=51298 RepID=A0A7J7WVY5_MYOMY|nr:hypothetical protein mMyoMyo1_011959 [Myotis myotis]
MSYQELKPSRRMPRYILKYDRCSKCYIFSFALTQRLTTNKELFLPRLRIYPASDTDWHGGHRAGSGFPGHVVGHREGAAGHAHGGLGQLVVLRPLVELGVEALDALLVLLLALVPAAHQGKTIAIYKPRREALDIQPPEW